MYLEQRDSKFIQEAYMYNGFNNLMFVKTNKYKKIISKRNKIFQQGKLHSSFWKTFKINRSYFVLDSNLLIILTLFLTPVSFLTWSLTWCSKERLHCAFKWIFILYMCLYSLGSLLESWWENSSVCCSKWTCTIFSTISRCWYALESKTRYWQQVKNVNDSFTSIPC